MTHSADNTTSVSGPLGSWSLTYDDASRLSSVTYPDGTDSFTYNALGQRMRASLDGTVYRYVYNGQRVVEETNDAGSVLARHTTANGSYYGPWLHMWRSEDIDRFPLFDAVGTARGLVDASATVTDSYVLDSFGTPTGAATATINPYHFGGAWGYLTDTPGSGLLELGARFYWPELGRFVQQDPLSYGMNWYAYAGNNPVVYVDPEGEVPVIAVAAGVVVVGGAVWIYTHPDEAKAAVAAVKKTIGDAARALWTGTGETMPVPSTDYGRAAGSGGTTVGVSVARTREAQWWIDEGLEGNDVPIEEIQAERECRPPG